jgi:hypothetical protein
MFQYRLRKQKEDDYPTPCLRTVWCGRLLAWRDAKSEQEYVD